MGEIPQKDVYKLSEVCQYTDTQPYVLRFWEGEFPELQPGKSASGQRLYRRRDIDVVQRIKELLHDEEYTLESAREMLAQELAQGKRIKPRRPAKQAAAKPLPAKTPAPVEQIHREPRRKISEPTPAAGTPVAGVPRERYQHAVEEIDHLRSALKEAERNFRRAEAESEEAREAATNERERAVRAIRYLERLEQILS